MTKKIKTYFFSIATNIYIYIISGKLIRKKYTRVFVFDIDNTIAHTWYSFNASYFTSNKQRLLSLPIYIKMHRVIDILYNNPNNLVVFLTARSLNDYKTTYKWLKGQGFPLGYSDLFIVNSPKYKINIISSFKKQKTNVYYIDDLSYNHENGEVKFYKKEIFEIENLTAKNKHIKYYGYDHIESFINS